MLRVTERQQDRKVTSTGPGDQLGVLEVGSGRNARAILGSWREPRRRDRLKRGRTVHWNCV